jgi:hypothetical protein
MSQPVLSISETYLSNGQHWDEPIRVLFNLIHDVDNPQPLLLLLLLLLLFF